MSSERKYLLLSAIFMIAYLILNLVFSNFNIKTDNTWVFLINAFIYGSSIIGIGLFMYFALSKNINLEDNRGMILFISVLFFIYNIVSGILGFIVASKINKRKLRDLPKLEIIHSYNNYFYILAFILCMGIIFGLPRLIDNSYILNSLYLVILVITVYMFRKDLVRDFSYFKKYFREYNSYVLMLFVKSFIVMFILSLSIRLTTNISTSTNQTDINTAFKIMPVFISLLALVYAPIAEEIMYRGFIKKIISKKWVFIIVSGVLFGVSHVIDDFKSVSELLYILLYSSLGCFLAYTYYETKNICCSIYFHFIQNAISVLAMIIAILI